MASSLTPWSSKAIAFLMPLGNDGRTGYDLLSLPVDCLVILPKKRPIWSWLSSTNAITGLFLGKDLDIAPEGLLFAGLGGLLTDSFVLRAVTINFEREGSVKFSKSTRYRLPYRVNRRRPTFLHRLRYYNPERFHEIFLHKDRGPRLDVVYCSLVLPELTLFRHRKTWD